MSFLNTLLPSFGDKKEAFSQGLSLLLSKDSTNPEQVKDHMMKLFKSMEFSDAASADFAEAVARHWKEVHGRVIEISTSAVKSLAGGIFGRAEGSAAGITRQSAFEKRMHKFIEELKSPKGAFASMPAANGDDISPILKWFQEKVPMEGGRLRLKASGDHIAVAKYLALKLNNAFQAGINPDAPPEVLMRDVYVALSAIQAGLSSDFVAIYAAMNRFSDNIDMLLSALEVVRKEVGDLQPDQVGRRDELSQALGETIKALRSNSQLLRSTLHSDALRQLVGPDAVADSVLSQRFNNIMKLENVDNSQQVSFLLSRVNRLFQITNALSGWSKTLEDHAKGVLAAFFNEKLSQEEFRKLISEKLADVKLTTVVSPGTSTSKPTSMEEILKRLEQSRMELLDSGRMGDVKATLAERGEYTGSGYSGMAELPRHETIKTQIERVREGRKTLIKAAVTRVSALFSQVISCIQSLTEGVMAGSVPASAGLHNLQNDLALLKDIAKSNLFYPLLGVYVEPTQGVERHRFINSLMVLKTRASGMTSESPIYGRLVEAIGALLSFIEEAQSQNRSTYNQGLMNYGSMGAIGGGVGDPYAIDLDVLPQLKTVMVRYTEQLQELMYAINFHQGLRRMQRAGKDMAGTEEQHARARAEAFGYKQTEVKARRDELLYALATDSSGSDEAKASKQFFNIGAAAAADDAEIKAAQDMIRDFAEAKLKLLQTSEAFDGMLEKFMRATARDPKIFYELYKEIQANPGIADWFNESSGNMLVEWFEAFPVYSNANGNPVGKKGWKVANGQHYYDMLIDPVPLTDLKDAAGPGAAAQPLFPWHLGNHLVAQFPSAYAEHKRKSRMVYQGTAALKNILTAFVNVAKQLGNEQIFSFMTPTTMYQNLIEYLTVSAFSRGFQDQDNAIAWLVMPTLAGGVLGALNDATRLQSAVALSYANVIPPNALVPYGGVNIAQPQIKTGIYDMNLGNNHVISSFAFQPNKGLSRIYVGTAISAAAYVPAAAADEPAIRRAILRAQYGFSGAVVYAGMKSTFDDTDMLFVTMMQGIYSKIMVAINVDKMLHRPLRRTDFMTIRGIVGGDEAIPEVRPEYIRVYFGLILLAEFYRDLFEFNKHGGDTAPDTNIDTKYFISMLPEGASPYGPLIACVFDRYAGITKGEYSDIQARNLISICNQIIDATSGGSADEKIEMVFDNFVAEVNKRYAVMMEEDAKQYQEWLKEAIPGPGRGFDPASDARSDDLIILPGEDDAFRFDGVAPSSSYVAASKLDSPDYKKWSQTTLEDKWRRLINRWRAKVDSYMIDGSDEKIMSWEEKSVIGDLLRDTEMDVRMAKDSYSRYIEVLKLISTSSSSYAGDANKVLMLQEVLAGIEVLKQAFTQLAKASDIAYHLANPERIEDAMRPMLIAGGGGSLGTRLKAIADAHHSFSKYINIGGVSDANLFDATLGLLWAKPSGDVGFNPAVDQNVAGVAVYGAAQYNRANANWTHIGTTGADLANWYENTKERKAATKANREALFQAVFNHDTMFADLMQLCIDLDHVNIGSAANAGAKLVDVVIRDGAISVNTSNLRQHIFSMFEHLQTLMNSLRSTLPKKDLAEIEGSAGLGLATLRFLFVEKLFQDRRTSEDNTLGLGELNQNIGMAFQYFQGKRTVSLSTFISDFDKCEWSPAAWPVAAVPAVNSKVALGQALTSTIGQHPRTIYFPVYGAAAGQLVNFEQVFRLFTHFNALLPNSGLPYVAKELRAELPIYAETAPPISKTTRGMFWKHEIGFPDALKIPSASDSYSNHSLLLDFNRGLFNYVNDIFDMGNGKVYTKAIQSFLSGQVGSAARLENSFPDTLPNLNAIMASIQGPNADSDREPLLSTLVGTPIAGITYQRDAQRDPANWIGAAVAGFVTPFSDLIPSTINAMYIAPINVASLKNYAISLEQFVFATRFFSSKSSGAYFPSAAMADNANQGNSGDPANVGGVTAAAIANFMVLMSGYAANDNGAGASNWIAANTVKGAHTFIDTMYRVVIDKVPYRAPRTPKIDIGWGIRRDPHPTSVVMSSVALLLYEIATNKIEGETGYRHQYTSLADVPEFIKEAMRCKMPYYMSYFGALAARTNVLRGFLNSLSFGESPYKAAMYEEIDASDITGRRTEVWGNSFKSSALQFVNEIQRVSEEVRNMINEAYMDLTDVPRLMEMPGGTGSQMANAGLALALAVFRCDTGSMTDLSIGNHDPVVYRYLYGLRGLLGLSSAIEPSKNLPGYIEIVSKYNGMVDATFKIADTLRDSFASSFVTLYRWTAGNRFFKPATLNQDKLVFSEVKVATALPMFRDAAVASNNADAAAGGDNHQAYVTGPLGNDLIKFLLMYSELVPVRGASRFNDVFTMLANEDQAGNDGREVRQQGRTNTYAKLYNQRLLITNINLAGGQAQTAVWPSGDAMLGSSLNSSIIGTVGPTNNMTPSHTQADMLLDILAPLCATLKITPPGAQPEPYALRMQPSPKPLRDIVDIVANPDVTAKLREVIEFIMGGGTKLQSLTREKMRSLVLRFFNIVPLNPNVVGREIGAAHTYNAAYNFRRMIMNRLGLDRGDRRKLIGEDQANLDGSTSMRELWYRLLANPYAGISIVNYEQMIGGFMRGNNELDLGRPKFLSDQVYSKALFGSLYESARDVQPAGPKASQLADRNMSTKNNVEAYYAARTIVTGITNLLISNEAMWMKRDEELRKLLEDNSYLFRVPIAQQTGINAYGGSAIRPSFTTNHVFEFLKGDAFYCDVAIVPGNESFRNALFKTQYLTQLIKLSQVSTFQGIDLGIVGNLVRAAGWDVDVAAKISNIGAAEIVGGGPGQVNLLQASDAIGYNFLSATLINAPYRVVLNAIVTSPVGVAVMAGAANYGPFMYASTAGGGNVKPIAHGAELNAVATWPALYAAMDSMDAAHRWNHMALRYVKCGVALAEVTNNGHFIGGIHDGANAPEILPTRFMAPNVGVLPIDTQLSRFPLSGAIREFLGNIFKEAVRHIRTVDLSTTDIQTIVRDVGSKIPGPIGGILQGATIAGLAERLPNTTPALPHLNGAIAAATERLSGFLCCRPYNRSEDVYGSSFYQALPEIFGATGGAELPRGTNNAANRDLTGADQGTAITGVRGIRFFSSVTNRPLDTRVSTIELERVRGFAAMVAIAQHVLDAILPTGAGPKRTDLIITNALWSRNYSTSLAALDPTCWATEQTFWRGGPSGPAHESGRLYHEFAHAVIQHVSSSQDAYLPFDNTFYGVESLHNVSIGHGAETAALALSTTAYPTLLRIFNTPAICLPIQPSGRRLSSLSTIYSINDRSAALTATIPGVAAILTSLLASERGFATASYADKCKLLERVWNKLFSNNHNAGNSWAFTFTRGDPNNAIHTCEPQMAGEKLQAEKSKTILLQHAKFLMLVHHLAFKSVAGAPTADAALSPTYVASVTAILNSLGSSPFHGANYHRYYNSGNNWSAGKAPSAGVSIIERVARVAANRANSYPIKFGLAAFLDSVDTLGKPLVAPAPAAGPLMRITQDGATISDEAAHAVQLVGAAIATAEWPNAPLVAAAQARYIPNSPMSRGLIDAQSTAAISVAPIGASALGNSRNLVLATDGTDTFRSIQAQLSLSLHDGLVSPAPIAPELLPLLVKKQLRSTIELGALYEGMPLTYSIGLDANTQIKRMDLESQLYWGPIDGYTQNAAYVFTESTGAAQAEVTRDYYDPTWGVGCAHATDSFMQTEVTYLKAIGINLAGAVMPAGIGAITQDGAPGGIAGPLPAAQRFNGAPGALGAETAFNKAQYVISAVEGTYYAPSLPFALAGVVAITPGGGAGLDAAVTLGTTTVNWWGVLNTLGGVALGAAPSAAAANFATKQVALPAAAATVTTALMAGGAPTSLPFCMASASHRMARRSFSLAARGALTHEYAHFLHWLTNHGHEALFCAASNQNAGITTQAQAFGGEIHIDTAPIVDTHADTEYAFNDPYKAVYLKNDGTAEEHDFDAATGDAMRKIGKYRFDTKMVRNLVFIHNIHNLLAYDIEAALTDLSKAKVYGRNVFHPQLHEYAGNRNYQSDKENRTRDTSDWTPLTMHE